MGNKLDAVKVADLSSVGLKGEKLKGFLSLAGGMVDKYKNQIVISAIAIAVVHSVGSNLLENKAQSGFDLNEVSAVIASKNQLKDTFSSSEFRSFVSSFQTGASFELKSVNFSFNKLMQYSDYLSDSGYNLNPQEFINENKSLVNSITNRVNKEVAEINGFIVSDKDISAGVANQWMSMYEANDRSDYLALLSFKGELIEGDVRAVKNFKRVLDAHIVSAINSGFDINAAQKSLNKSIDSEVMDKKLEILSSPDSDKVQIASSLLSSLQDHAKKVVEKDAVRVSALLKGGSGEDYVNSLSARDKTRMIAFILHDNPVAYQDLYSKLDGLSIKSRNESSLPYSLENTTGYLSKSVPINVNTFDGINAVLDTTDELKPVGKRVKMTNN